MRADIPVGLQLLFSYAAVEEDRTSGVVIEDFDDSDKLGADVVCLHTPTKLYAKPCRRPSCSQ